jgi:LysM repeat protein
MTAALIPTPATLSVAPPVVAMPSISPEVYRQRRLAVLAVVIGLILGLASFGRQADATPTQESIDAAAVLVVVQPGDTLWGIAEELMPEADPRPLVAALRDIAGAGSLQPGQLLTVPGDLLD